MAGRRGMGSRVVLMQAHHEDASRGGGAEGGGFNTARSACTSVASLRGGHRRRACVRASSGADANRTGALPSGSGWGAVESGVFPAGASGASGGTDALGGMGVGALVGGRKARRCAKPRGAPVSLAHHRMASQAQRSQRPRLMFDDSCQMFDDMCQIGVTRVSQTCHRGERRGGVEGWRDGRKIHSASWPSEGVSPHPDLFPGGYLFSGLQ